MANGWTYDQTQALISIWVQEDVQRELDGVARNRTIYERVASELRKVGVEKTWHAMSVQTSSWLSSSFWPSEAAVSSSSLSASA